jgi:hypothetical protein
VKRMLRAALTCSLLLVWPAVATSQDEPARGRAPRGQPVLTNAELATMLDAYAIVQAQKVLQLSEDQYGRFVTRLKRLQDARRQATQSRNRLLQELRKLTNDGSSEEAAIRERLDALAKLDAESAQTIRQGYDAIDEVLDVRQRARFRIFEEQLERRKLDLLFRARERVRGRP